MLPMKSSERKTFFSQIPKIYGRVTSLQIVTAIAPEHQFDVKLELGFMAGVQIEQPQIEVDQREREALASEEG